MCRYGLPKAIVPDNGTQLSNNMITDFYKYLGVKMNFLSVVHPRAKGQAESTNKLIIMGLKKKLDDAKGLWVNLLHEI